MIDLDEVRTLALFIESTYRGSEDIAQAAGALIRLADEVDRLQAYSDHADGHSAVLDEEIERLLKVEDEYAKQGSRDREEIMRLREALDCLHIEGRHLAVRERTGNPDVPYRFVPVCSLLCGETISLLSRALGEVPSEVGEDGK